MLLCCSFYCCDCCCRSHCGHIVVVAGIFVIADPIIAVVAAVALENHFSFQMLIDVQCDVILKMVSLTGRLEQSPTEAMDKSRRCFSLWVVCFWFVVWIKMKMMINLRLVNRNSGERQREIKSYCY